MLARCSARCTNAMARPPHRISLDRGLSTPQVLSAFDDELDNHAHPLEHNAWKLDVARGLLK